MEPLPAVLGIAAISFVAVALHARINRRPASASRVLARALVVFGVLTFAGALLMLLTASAPDIGWAMAIPVAAFTAVGGVVLRKATPDALSPELAELAASLAPPPPSLPAPPHAVPEPRRGSSWPASMARVQAFIAVLELTLGIAFVWAGIRSPQTQLLIPGVLLTLLGIVFAVLWRRSVAKAGLATRGVRGEAEIVGLTQTGMAVNQNPVVGLDLIVAVPGVPRYLVRVREVVPLVALGRLTQGRPLDVKVDPRRPTKLLIEW